MELVKTGPLLVVTGDWRLQTGDCVLNGRLDDTAKTLLPTDRRKCQAPRCVTEVTFRSTEAQIVQADQPAVTRYQRLLFL